MTDVFELSADSVLEGLTHIFRGEGPYSEKPHSYFGRAIRGGRENLENDRVIVYELEKYTNVISKHTILDDVIIFERQWKKRFPRINVSQRDKKMIRMSECFFGDLTVESTGFGYEIGYARHMRRPMMLFCHEEARYEITILPYLHRIKVPIFYYDDQNVCKVAEREVRNFFMSRHPIKKHERFEMKIF